MIPSLLVIAVLGSSPAGTPGGVAPGHLLPAGDATALPINVSLVPPLSVNAPFQYRTVNALALDVLIGNSAALHGVQLSGLGSRNGEVVGVQLAGLGNWVDGGYGQSGGARGAQLGGVFNWTEGAVRGLQAAGVANVASGIDGVQLAGVLNVAAEAASVQVAPVNVARAVDGVQVGVVNVADDADVSVGVFSWVKNGTHDVGFAATEYGALAEADTGGRVLYGILTAGATYSSGPRRYLLGLGLGWRALDTRAVALDVQTVAAQMVDAGAWTERFLGSARAVVAMRVAGPLSIFGGPTFNVFVDTGSRKVDPAGYGWKAGSDVRLWPGFLAGARLF